jgi:hypothetical protein
MSASFYKLKDDSWGVRIKEFAGEPNMEVEVTTKAGDTKTVILANVSPSSTTQNYGHSHLQAPSTSAKRNLPQNLHLHREPGRRRTVLTCDEGDQTRMGLPNLRQHPNHLRQTI